MAQANPFASPIVRYGIAGSGAAIAAGVAYFLLSGTIQYVVYAIAVLDFLITPQILRRAAT
ncbi:MAG: hypothetical protein ACLFR6_04260 [Salinarchaeum sp.]